MMRYNCVHFSLKKHLNENGCQIKSNIFGQKSKETKSRFSFQLRSNYFGIVLLTQTTTKLKSEFH